MRNKEKIIRGDTTRRKTSRRCTNITNTDSLPDLKEAHNDGECHEEVDDGIGYVDDQHGNQVEALLVDQGKVQDQRDRQGHQRKQSYIYTTRSRSCNLYLFIYL
jgi:hypothetical protein